MVLPRAVAQAIGRGTKTQLRRPYRAEPPFTRERQLIQFERPRTYEDAPPKHAEDTTVREAVCYVVVTDQRVATLGEMTDVEARAEGFNASKGRMPLHHFKEWWEETYGTWRPGRRVWVVSFQVDRTERVQYLARGVGYTDSRTMAIDDLPVVPPAQIEGLGERHEVRAAREEHQRRAARERAARLRDSERKAQVRGVDIKAELAVLDHYLEVIHRRVHGDQ